MFKIITITGAKYSKKDLLASDLAKNSEVHLIYPYTDNQDAPAEYNIVSKSVLDRMINETEVMLSGNMINNHNYVFFQFQLLNGYNLLIVDDYSLVDLRSRWNGKLYTIKVHADGEKPSERVGEYLYDHEFDKVFNYGEDDLDELEYDIMDRCEPRG